MKVKTKKKYIEPTEADIRAAHLKIIQSIKDRYDDKYITPLTIHNALHSFETYFQQYSYALKSVPMVDFNEKQIVFSWYPKEGAAFRLSCQGPSFYWSCGPNASGWARRDAVMTAIKEALNVDLPVEPN